MKNIDFIRLETGQNTDEAWKFEGQSAIGRVFGCADRGRGGLVACGAL